jgi:hypothetical protein
MVPDGKVPENDYNEQDGIASVYLPAEQFLWYLDVLRHEDPVYVEIDPDDPIAHRPATGQEQPGEGE